MTHKILHTRHCPLHLLMVNGNPIQQHSKKRHAALKDPSPLMLSIERPKAAHVLDYEDTEMTLQHINTNFVQIPPRTETGLIAKGKSAVDRSTRSITACFHLSLLTHKRVEFSLCRFDFRPFDPANFKQPIQLPKEMESRVIVASNDNLRTETV